MRSGRSGWRYGMLGAAWLFIPALAVAQDAPDTPDAPVSVTTTLPPTPANKDTANPSPATPDASTKPATQLAPLPASPSTPNGVYTTKRMPDALPFGKASTPLSAPAPSSPAAGNANTAPPANPAAAGAPSPFGKSTAVMDRQFIAGPKSSSAVPVDNVDAIETGEPAPAEAVENIANPAHEDPAAPTELTAPIFSAQTGGKPHTTVLRVLNKVTARAEKIEVKPDQQVAVAKLLITASHCQHSDPTSLPDDAALVSIREVVDAKMPAKPIFSGWLYRSSPSINGLEHPIYDVSLVACNDAPAPPVEKKPKK